MSDEPFADPPEDDGAEPPPEQTFDAASPVQNRKRHRKIVREAAETQRFWQEIFATETGRREMWIILRDAGAFAERFSSGPVGFPDPHATWFHFGQTKFGLRLYHQWLKQSPEGVLLMLQENSAEFARPK